MDKDLWIRLYGRTDDKKEALLGEREMNIANYTHKVSTPTEIVLEKGTLKKNKMYLAISVVSQEQFDKLDLNETGEPTMRDSSMSMANFKVDDVSPRKDSIKQSPVTPKVETPGKQLPEKPSPIKEEVSPVTPKVETPGK